MQRSSKHRSRSPSLTASSSSSSSSSSSDDESKPQRMQTRFPYVPPPVFSSKVAAVITDAKRKHRTGPSLSILSYSLTLTHTEAHLVCILPLPCRLHTDIKSHEWGREGFAGSDVCELPLDESNPIKREHCSELSVERFIAEYEAPFVPVVIEGIPEAERWGAVDHWTLKRLRKQYKRVQLKCGEDDDGKSIRIKYKHFAAYMKRQTDDSPLYIFDSAFDEKPETKPLLEDYRVPRYFPDDLFALVGEARRPPYRWFLVGPKRSGTCVHLDPLGTSAWNTLLVGRKRWVLFPPDVPKAIVKGKGHVRRGEDDEAVNYFMDILPRIKRAHAPETLRCIELMQYPGDTIFVPGGWWHAVLNVEDTVAVTQNYCSPQNFDRVWRKTRSGRKRMAVKWLGKLAATPAYAHLADRARELNAADDFVMYSKASGGDDDKESESMAKKKKKKAEETESGDGSSKRKSKHKERDDGETSSRKKAKKM